MVKVRSVVSSSRQSSSCLKVLFGGFFVLTIYGCIQVLNSKQISLEEQDRRLSLVTVLESVSSLRRPSSNKNPHLLDCESLDQPDQDNGLFVQAAGDFQINIHSPKDDIWVSAEINERGCFECDLIEQVVVELQKDKQSILLDIGGNIGLYSLATANVGHDVFVFEPFRKNYQRICKSVMANEGFGQRIQLYDRAVVAQPMIVSFDAGGAHRNFGGIEVKQMESELGLSGVDFAKGVTIDSVSMFLPTDRSVVIKLDVEGNECNALAGGLEYFDNLSIQYVAIEWSGARLETCLKRDEIFALFAKNGLKPYLRNSAKQEWVAVDPLKWSTWEIPGKKLRPNDNFDMAWGKDL